MLRGDRRGERREFSLRADGPAVINRLHVPRLEATFGIGYRAPALERSRWRSHSLYEYTGPSGANSSFRLPLTRASRTATDAQTGSAHHASMQAMSVSRPPGSMSAVQTRLALRPAVQT